MLRELKRNYRRIVAFMLTVAMTFTNVGTNLNVAFAAGEEESGLFLLSGEDLREAIDEALEAGETFDYSTLDVKSNSKSLLKKYKELLGGAAGKVYELNVDVDDSYAPMDTELQVFYNEGTENVVFLFVNGSDMAVTFRANVDGYETARVTVNPNTQIVEDAANAEDYSDATVKNDLPETLGAEVIPTTGDGETTEADETTEATSPAETSAEETGETTETSETESTEATTATEENGEAAETSPAETAESTESTTEAATTEAATTAEEMEATTEAATTEEATTAAETKEVTEAPTEAETEAQTEAPAGDEEEAFQQVGMSVHKVQLVASTVTILDDEVPGAPEPEDEDTTEEATTAEETTEAEDDEADVEDKAETKVEIVDDATTESKPSNIEETPSTRPETTTEAADPTQGTTADETLADDTTDETTVADETTTDESMSGETTDETIADETLADETITNETTAADVTTDGGGGR